MSKHILNKLDILLVLVLIFAIVPIVQGAAGDPDLDDMTGGMSSDSTSLLSQLIFWLVMACLALCVITGAIAVVSSDSTETKRSAYSFVGIIAIVLFFYFAKFSIEYLLSRYGS